MDFIIENKNRYKGEKICNRSRPAKIAGISSATTVSARTRGSSRWTRLFAAGGCPQWKESARPVQRRAEIADILRGMEKHLSHIAAWLRGGD